MKTPSITSPSYDPSIDYFDENFKLSFANERLGAEYDRLVKEVQELWLRIQKQEKKLFGRRERRPNAELKKFFTCDKCSRSYAYKSSLNMHTKTKHSSNPLS